MVPKSHGLRLQKRVEELERALGRRALGSCSVKKPTSSKGTHYPMGHKHKMVGEERKLFVGVSQSQTGAEPRTSRYLSVEWTERRLGNHDRLEAAHAQRDRVPQRQWARIHLASGPTVRAGPWGISRTCAGRARSQTGRRRPFSQLQERLWVSGVPQILEA